MNTYHCIACLADAGTTPGISMIWHDAEYALCHECNKLEYEDIDRAIIDRVVATMPKADARRATIDAWYAAQPKAIPHESPPIENGPSLVCNACGFIRVNILKGPFCKACTKIIKAAVSKTSEAVAP